MLFRLVLVLWLMSFFAGHGWAAPPAATLAVPSWQALGPFPISPREVNGDPLERYGLSQPVRPDKTHVFHSVFPDQGEVRWFDVDADGPNIRFRYEQIDWQRFASNPGFRSVRGLTYLYGELTAPERTVALVHSQRLSTFWINETKYLGEPYYANFPVPVVLEKGLNRVLLRVGGKIGVQTKFAVTPTQAPALFVGDDTLPDLNRDQPNAEELLATTVLNPQETWLRGATLHFPATEWFEEQTVRLPDLPPFGVHKSPVQLRRTLRKPAASLQSISQPVWVLNHQGERLAEHQLTLRVLSRREAQQQTFRSAMDHSVQYYGLRFPAAYQEEQPYGLIVSLHGAGVEALHLAADYSPKDWAFVVTPTNRRRFGFDWQDWGREDALEVIAEVRRRFQIDPNRIYLAGASMGGQGTWHIGLHHPSLFAALAPQAGWTNFRTYTPAVFWESEAFTPPRFRGLQTQLRASTDNPFFVPNAQHLPTVITQGGLDRTVPPFHARIYRSLLAQRNHKVLYRELPDKEHWWNEPRVNGVGADAVDNPEIINFLKKQQREPLPKEVQFRLVDLSLNHEFYWLTVLQQERPWELTTGTATVAANRVTLETQNVRQIQLRLPPALIPSSSATVTWNGVSHPVTLEKSRVVTLGEAPQGVSKTPTRYGPLKGAFLAPFVLVYGTQGTPEETARLMRSARALAHLYWRRANASPQIYADTDLPDALEQSHNLILLGSPARNRVTRRVMQNFPITITPDPTSESVLFGERRLRGELGLALVYPNPAAPQRLVGIFAGTSVELGAQALTFQPLYSGSSTPDYVIFDETVSQYGWGGVIEAGLFDSQWQLP
jgi:poly(3-hydroxybutyrate) depolymerase